MIGSNSLFTQILLLALLGACLWVLAPFVSALFWAAVLAFATWPLMRYLTERLDGNKSMAASILTCGWVLLFAIPLFWLVFNLADYIHDGTEMLKNIKLTGMPVEPSWVQQIPFIGEKIHDAWAALDEEAPSLFSGIKPYMGELGNWLLARSAYLAGGILELALSLFLVFFFYRDGARLAVFVRALVFRFLGERTDRYMDLVAGTVRRVVNGVIGTATAQAIVAFIGFKIAGVPGAQLLSGFTFMLSLIPMGPPLIWAPAAAWLFFQEQYAMGVFLSIWGFVVISSVDNILKPYLISRGGNLPLIVVLLGVFGGLIAFGFMGLFLGPTLLAVAYSLLGEWISVSEKQHQLDADED